MTTTLAIQRRLAELGYQPGPLDGIPGPAARPLLRSSNFSGRAT